MVYVAEPPSDDPLERATMRVREQADRIRKQIHYIKLLAGVNQPTGTEEAILREMNRSFEDLRQELRALIRSRGGG